MLFVCLLLAYFDLRFTEIDTDITNWCRINYAFYEEIKTEDVERTRDVYWYAKAYLF